MNFDIITRSKCLLRTNDPECTPLPPGAVPGPGGEVPCCQDADFAASAPTTCGVDPNRLILKPGFLRKPILQQVTFKAFLYTGGKETDLDADAVTYRSSDTAVAVIGASSGNCSTVSPGTCTITATFGTLMASAQVQVVADCASKPTDFLILIDNSASMGIPFSNSGGTKLDFSKTQAKGFLDTIDFDKDRAAVFSMTTSATQVQGITNLPDDLKSAIDSISNTISRTSIKASLDACIAYLAQESSGRTRVIVFFSDGENKTGGNPIPSAASFKTGGGVLVVVGVRAWNGGFSLLEAIATPGFFANCYSTTEAALPAILSGVKGYLCSGNCDPPPNLCVPYAALNYNKFANWNVDGLVDLVGEGIDTLGNPSGQPLFDFLPGNGLYVDMCGSSSPWRGTLTTKSTFVFDLTRDYRIRIKVAGNQRQDLSPWTLNIKVRCLDVDNNENILLDETITVLDWKQDFTEYSFTFSGADPNNVGRVIISAGPNPANSAPYVGLLVDDIVLESGDTGNVDSDTETMFSDDFDTENLTCLSSGLVSLGPNLIPNGAAYNGEQIFTRDLTLGQNYFWRPGANADRLQNGSEVYLAADWPNGVFFQAALTGTGTWRDEAGTNPLTATGTVAVVDPLVSGAGHAASFEAAGFPFLSCPNAASLQLTGVFGVLLAVKVVTLPSTDHGWVLLKGLDDGIEYGLRVNKVDDLHFFHALIGTVGGPVEINSEIALVAGQTYAVAFGYSTLGRIYLKVKTTDDGGVNETESDPPIAGTGSLAIGSDSNTDAPLLCVVDNVSLASVEIPVDDVIALYNGTTLSTSLLTNLISYWPLDGDQTSTAILATNSPDPLPVMDILAAASDNCPPEVPPGTCLDPQPDNVQIAGYSDIFFQLDACLDNPTFVGETFCTGSILDAWDGSFAKDQPCGWLGTGSAFGRNGTVQSGKLVYSARIDFDENLNAYVMNIEVQLCVISDSSLGETTVVWSGSKVGTSPIGTYTKILGCAAGLDTITVGITGQQNCGGGIPNPASGCIDDSPIPAQVPDPDPAADIEPCALNTGEPGPSADSGDILPLI